MIHSPIRPTVWSRFVMWLCLAAATVSVASVSADSPADLRSAEQIKVLLDREPITPGSWPAWRDRLRDWFGDRTNRADPAYEAAIAFLLGQANTEGQLPAMFDRDAVAWYLLGHGMEQKFVQKGGSEDDGVQAERAYRRSLKIDPTFARPHRNLARLYANWSRIAPGPTEERQKVEDRLKAATTAIAEARRLDPGLSGVAAVEGELAIARNDSAAAERFFLKALDEQPDNVGYAIMAGLASLSNRSRSGAFEPAIARLVAKFPDSGELAALHGVALAQDGHYVAATDEIDRARKLGADPKQLLGASTLAAIECEARPGRWMRTFGWTMAGFAVFYAAVMALMAGFGLILSRRTRGIRALDLLGDPQNLLEASQIRRTGHESLLATLYALALVAGLMLFYFAVPFIVAGLLACTGLLLYGIFTVGRVPVKLVAFIFVIGVMMAWAVVKSLFSAMGRGSFGVLKSPEQCPRLHQVVRDVAKRIDTRPVDELYVAPGAEIGVHQEGRGPFGMFGVKKRVLTLGLSTMHFLTVGELQGILAHEYAHFSHRDTLYSRFIHQVTMSIENALNGIGAAAGKLNYVNPIFWFLYLYHRAYSLLAAGFSRSREFLADRMAAGLYGSDVFTSALTKVATDGQLFEATVYQSISQLLAEEKMFVNLYQSFREFRDEQLTAKDRQELFDALANEKESVFASHPTFRERIEAVQPLPKAQSSDTQAALSLFDQPDEIEKELTEFLTSYVHLVQQVQAGAAAA